MSAISEFLLVPLQSDGGGVFGAVSTLIAVVVALVTLAGMWKAFQRPCLIA